MIPTDYAYMAGAMDSDGYFTIKKSTYAIRVRKDAGNPVYSEKLGLHQVTPQIPELLRAAFGGSVLLAPQQTPNSRPLYRWDITDRNAAGACEALLPFLRIKRRQAELILELRRSKAEGFGQVAHWFSEEYPDWPSMELMTTQQVVDALHYSGPGMVSQAIRNGTLLSLPYDRSGTERPRIPRILVERLAENQGRSKDGHGRTKPPQLIAWRDRLWAEIRELNTLGIAGTSVNHRTGYHAPK
jgi:hypothetical protein